MIVYNPLIGRRATLRAATVLALGAALILSGCNSFGRQARPRPLPAVPSQPVQTAELPPPEAPLEPQAPISQEPLPGEAAAQPPTELAAAETAPALEVGRTDLLGGWAIASGGDSCQLFMSLTTWTGGYRASTRGCSDPTLASISAWELEGNTVTLKSGEAAGPVASLQATDPQRFSGATTTGSAITVTR